VSPNYSRDDIFRRRYCSDGCVGYRHCEERSDAAIHPPRHCEETSLVDAAIHPPRHCEETSLVDAAIHPPRHCEERSDAAIHNVVSKCVLQMDCRVAFQAPRNDGKIYLTKLKNLYIFAIIRLTFTFNDS
jgi:hypothetical protein